MNISHSRLHGPVVPLNLAIMAIINDIHRDFPTTYAQLRFQYSDQKGPDINELNKEYLNNYSSYTFLLWDITLPMMSDHVDQLW